jgi:hypothetical protein
MKQSRALRDARLGAGVRQIAIAKALGVAHQLVSMWERGLLVPDPIQFARWGAAVGRDVRLGVYVAGSALRDQAHIRLFVRARDVMGGPWTWRTEVAVSTNPLDRRAIDALMVLGSVRVGLEFIPHLIDAQAQLRQANLKLEASGIDCMIMVLADTRNNREAVRGVRSYLTGSFPLGSRAVLAALRAGKLPAANGIVFVQA